MEKINVALVGLAFGGSFLPIYDSHPNVGKVGIFDIDSDLLGSMKERYPDAKVYGSFEEILKDNEMDAVHIVTPIPYHADQTVAVLESGKHCACTVPMATSLKDIKRIISAKRKSGKKYMMMETSVYTYPFFYAKEMQDKGEFGKIQFMRGDHYQDMVNWPDYWLGLPPMWYGTHAIAPMVMLSGSRISRVRCLGSGTMDAGLVERYGNPYPVESALLEFENGCKGEVTRALFEIARVYREGFNIYGDKASFEWGFQDSDDPYITIGVPPKEGVRGTTPRASQVKVPNYEKRLPKEIQSYTVVDEHFDPLNPQFSLKIGVGGGHHGSHPHLVHEFVMSIIEDRTPWIDENIGANITGAGICAHQSAMENGAVTEVPVF